MMGGRREMKMLLCVRGVPGTAEACGVASWGGFQAEGPQRQRAAGRLGDSLRRRVSTVRNSIVLEYVQ